jgi:outer membrane protein OmpA-like peptidoglycan-associated protein
MLLFLALSCVKYGPVQSQHKQLIKSLETAEADQWSRTCAPKEMALASAHKEFAEIEFQQGGTLRAEEHLLFALQNVEQAIKTAEECRPKDIDGDGIMDNVDDCPKIPELFNNYQDEDGCPEKDTDNDTIFDDKDACITVREDIDNFQDEDGCPEYDNDKDGIVDVADKCPNIPEDYDGFKDEDGCPEETGDTDGDGILDDVDMCPNIPEPFNSYKDEDGCYDEVPRGVRVTKTAIIIDEKIYFQTAKAVILPKSFDILNSVAQAMKDYEKISVQVQGHTDSDGSESYNLKLSNRRANAVKEYLIKAGIDESRLESKGFGESTPIAENKTAAGKEKNRRVEFKIISGMK